MARAEREIGPVGLAVLTAVATVVPALALYGVWALWPESSPVHGPAPVAVAACAGALGGLPCALRSLAVSAGNRELRARAVLRLAAWLAIALSVAAVAAAAAVWIVPSGARPRPYQLAAAASLVGLLVPVGDRASARRRLKRTPPVRSNRPHAGISSAERGRAEEEGRA